MTMAKRLYELLILALIWLPVAGIAVLVMDTVDHLAGPEANGRHSRCWRCW